MRASISYMYITAIIACWCSGKKRKAEKSVTGCLSFGLIIFHSLPSFSLCQQHIACSADRMAKVTADLLALSLTRSLPGFIVLDSLVVGKAQERDVHVSMKASQSEGREKRRRGRGERMRDEERERERENRYVTTMRSGATRGGKERRENCVCVCSGDERKGWGEQPAVPLLCLWGDTRTPAEE